MVPLPERSFHKTSSPYVLPNDASEHERLELQTAAIDQMMLGQRCHAPITQPKRILEIGCGTGSMTTYFAETYENAQDVIGIDLSPMPPKLKASRAKFLQGNFRSMVGLPEYPQLQPNSFDYFFSRMLVYGMTDWPGYIAQAKWLLAPGGWIELQEALVELFDENQKQISGSWQWFRDQNAAWLEKGLDMQIPLKLEGYLKDAGFVDVQVKQFRWVYGRWEGHPETDMIGDYSPKYLPSLNVGAYRKVMASKKTPQELDVDEEQMMEGLAHSDNGKYQPFYAVYGRKPWQKE